MIGRLPGRRRAAAPEASGVARGPCPHGCRDIAAEHDRIITERDRIAVDLNDGVIRSMFTVSLTLHGALALADREGADARVREAIGELDQAISVVRTSVFELAEPDAAAPSETIPRAA